MFGTRTVLVGHPCPLTNPSDNLIPDVIGPSSDHLGNLERYFVYASPSMSGSYFKPHQTYLRSPYLIGQEHPVECLKFWFTMKVMYT